MLSFDLICIQTFLWAGWTTMFWKSPHIMFRFSENLLPCHLRELHARSLTVCLSLLLTPTLALHEHVRVSLSLPPSPSSLSFFCAYIHAHFSSLLPHTQTLSCCHLPLASVRVSLWLFSEQKVLREERAETMCRSWPTLYGLVGYSEH